MAKRAKENTELAQIEEQEKLNALYIELELNSEGEGGTGGNSYDAIEKLLEFKRAIADAIESAGGIKPEIIDESTTFADAIKGIVAEVTKNATATAEDIAEGKTAWANGNEITGTKEGNIKLDNTSVKVLSNSYWYTQDQCNASYKVTEKDEKAYSHLMLLYCNAGSINFPTCGGKTTLISSINFFNAGNGSIILIEKPTTGSTFSYTSNSGSYWYKGFIVLGISY